MLYVDLDYVVHIGRDEMLYAVSEQNNFFLPFDWVLAYDSWAGVSGDKSLKRNGRDGQI